MSTIAGKAAAQAVIVQNFRGSTFGVDTGFIPPDTMGAVGLSHVVELINGRFSVYLKTTGARVQTKTLDQFWLDAGVPGLTNFSFDPRVVYDPIAGRWYAGACDGAGVANNFLVAVSATSDPTGAWAGFRIDSDTDNGETADFPTMGFSADRVVICANMFSLIGGANSVTALVVPKAGLTAPTPTVAGFTLFQNIASANTGFSVQPSADYAGAGNTLYVLSSFNLPSGVLKLSSIAGTAAVPTLVTAGGSISVTGATAPPTAPQPPMPTQKANINTGDSRFSASIVRAGGSLWAVQAFNSSGRSAIRWYKLDAATAAVQLQGAITHPSLALYFPSVAVTPGGDVVIACSGSSATQPVSAYAFVGRPASNQVFFNGPLLLQAGVDDYERLDNNGRNRWGDYSSITPDPADANRVWAVQEFVSFDNTYALQVTAIRICRPDWNLSQTLEPTDIFAYLNSYFAGDAKADFNNDGTRNSADIFAYLNAYFAGCD